MKIEIFHSLKDMDRNAWGQIVGSHFPFHEFDYLYALEKAGCVGPETGWIPHYITAWEGRRLSGALYLYEKSHSYGEYIFDWEWARAYHSLGVPYYPKLVSTVPFTPATGSRLLCHPDADPGTVATALLSAAVGLGETMGASSLHFLFLSETEIPLFEAAGYSLRHSFQYHWTNRGYRDFTEFIGALKPKKGKQILRERSQLDALRIPIRCYIGENLTSAHSRAMYGFYLSTIEKMGAIPYLNGNFFDEVFKSQRAQVVLWLAGEEGDWVAGALHFRKGDHLFGRYWGCREEIRNLHFELCYYRAIEYAIQHNLRVVEAGAQGEHKIQRGFLPCLTYSAHLISHPQLGPAIRRFLSEEKGRIARAMDEMSPHLPFR